MLCAQICGMISEGRVRGIIVDDAKLYVCKLFGHPFYSCFPVPVVVVFLNKGQSALALDSTFPSQLPRGTVTPIDRHLISRAALGLESDTMQSSSLVMEHYSKFIWPTDTTATVSPVSGDVNPKATEPGDISESLIPITSHEITSIISKPESKKMLKELCNCNDLLAARKLAAPILKRHMHSDQGLCKYKSTR